MPVPNEVQNAEIESAGKLLQSGFWLVEFWADWCPYCLLVKRKTEKLADLYAGRIRTARLNVESHAGTADDLHVEYIPATLFLHDGKVVERWYGDTPIPLISRVIDECLRSS